MGVTIHFRGKLKTDNDYKNVMLAAKEFALQNEMDFSYIDEADKLLLRYKDDKEWDYRGPTRGIRIQPHENSDPFILEFDEDNYVQEYCKTQYVDAEIHAKLIGLLKSIEPNFEKLTVVDEGDYWETNDLEILQDHLETIFLQIEVTKQNDETLDGPFKVADGRIADLMRNRK